MLYAEWKRSCRVISLRFHVTLKPRTVNPKRGIKSYMLVRLLHNLITGVSSQQSPAHITMWKFSVDFYDLPGPTTTTAVSQYTPSKLALDFAAERTHTHPLQRIWNVLKRKVSSGTLKLFSFSFAFMFVQWLSTLIKISLLKVTHEQQPTTYVRNELTFWNFSN